MTTRGGTRRDLFRAIEERDRIIADLRAELAGERAVLVACEEQLDYWRRRATERLT